MVPKGHDLLAPSSVPETSSSAGAVYRGSPSVEPEDRDSPIQIMSPGNTAARCAKNQDSLVGRVAPIVRDGLLRMISGRSASPGMEVCSSVTPTTGAPGKASLAPTNGSKPHGILAPSFTPKGCESVVPSLALGNSKSTGMKHLNSAPRMTPQGQGFLSLGIASQSPAPHSVKGQASLALVAIPPVAVPGHGNSPSMGAAGRDSLALSITPKGHDGPASSKPPKCRESPRAGTLPASDRSQGQDAATKVYNNAPTPITGEPKDQVTAVTREPKNQTAQCGSQNKSSNKSSGPGPDASNHVTGAASALVALSTLREKGGR
uniref:Uncharacterized protein n=1 Tax=Arundo donax TaxID=35708 RepID=A0A0A9D2T5_ARUDO